MNEMVERYIYDVTRRLPEKDRIEVGRELEASVNDMLPDNPGEQDIIDALAKLGEPRILAEKYRDKPRYLISSAMYEMYITVLKMVVKIVACVCACAGVLISFSTGSIGEIIGTGIGMAIEGALQAAFWVTLGFALADRFGTEKKPWTINDLPPLPEQDGVKISRSSSIVGMILSVFFTVLLILMIVRGEWIFVLAHNTEIIVPFSQAALYRLIPYIILLGVIGLVINGLKLYWARWNLKLCIANIIQNIAWLFIVLYILRWPDLLSAEVVAFTKSLFVEDADVLRFIESGGIAVFFAVVFVAAAAIDIGVSVRNTWKGARKLV